MDGRRRVVDLGQLGRGGVVAVDVTAEQEHGRRRRRSLHDGGEQIDGLVERLPERRPVFEVEHLADSLAEPLAGTSPRAFGDGFVPPLEVVHTGKHQPGERGGEDEVIEGLVGAGDVLAHPLPLRGVDHPAVFGIELARASAVDGHQAHPASCAAEVPVVAEADRRRIEVGRPRHVIEVLRPFVVVGDGAHPGVDLVAVELVRAEVAEVLVHPVRAVAADDAVMPPRRGRDLAPPRQRRVPVVAQVVVVEQHPGRNGGQQPTHRRWRPGFVVEPGVLLVVLDLVDDVRARIDVHGAETGNDGVGGLIGVHLVADQQQRIGPCLVRRLGHLGGQRGERVGADGGEVLVVEWIGSAAAPERQAERSIGIDGPDHAGRERRVIRWPHVATVQGDRVLVRRAWDQTVDEHEGVVVVVHAPRVGSEGSAGQDDLDRTRSVRLDPDRGAGLVGVPQQRPDEQRRDIGPFVVRPG